ncbi:MAG: glycosyltransferase [Pseudomonadota bacterium]|nr:glycosyltransferase [Pseudomonadota bacterium]
MTSLVTVIIPAYNHEDFVVEAIASVLAQSLKDFELLIVDDGSTDSTLDRIRTFADPRITVIVQENRGAAAALNRGLEEAKGRYISILNSDDRYHPDRLQRLYETLENSPGVSLAVTGIKVINREGEREAASWLERGLDYYKKSGTVFFAVIRDNFICSTSNFFFHRELLKKTGLFLPLRYCHDLDFILQVGGYGEVLCLDEVLLDYRVHGSNTIKESRVEGSELFKFEVSSVIAYALGQQGVSLEKAPFFLDDLLMTQLGAVLDLVGLMVCFFKSMSLNRQQFSELLIDAEHPLKTALLELIKEKVEKDEHPWKKYSDILGKYEEKQGIISSMSQTIVEKEGQLGVFGEKITDLNQLIYLQKDEIESQKEEIESQKDQIALQEQTNRWLDGRLNEIYNSRGWLWLTRYRRVTDFLRSLIARAKALKEGLPEKEKIEKKIEEKESQAYTVAIIHPINQSRPRIVHAIANVMTGGSTQLVVDLYEHLGHKYEQVVATMFMPEKAAYYGLPVFDFSRLANAQEFAKFLDEQQADLLHIHYWGECDEEWYRKIFSATEIYPCPVVENINIPVSAYLHSAVFRYVFVSNYAATYTKSLPENSQVIYPGSHLSDFTRQGVEIPDDVIGMVYRLEADKLNEESIEVFIEVVKRRSQTRVYIIGGGSFLAVYRGRVEEEGLVDNFEFTDYLPFAELPDYYRKLSLFVAPVWRESFGQVSTFAMNMELPVVGYRAGGVREMVGNDTCFAHDKDALATLIVELLDDRKRRLELGRANRERALELFSVESMVKQYDQVYNQGLKSI